MECSFFARNRLDLDKRLLFVRLCRNVTTTPTILVTWYDLTTSSCVFDRGSHGNRNICHKDVKRSTPHTDMRVWTVIL